MLPPNVYPDEAVEFLERWIAGNAAADVAEELLVPETELNDWLLIDCICDLRSSMSCRAL